MVIITPAILNKFRASTSRRRAGEETRGDTKTKPGKDLFILFFFLKSHQQERQQGGHFGFVFFGGKI